MTEMSPQAQQVLHDDRADEAEADHLARWKSGSGEFALSSTGREKAFFTLCAKTSFEPPFRCMAKTAAPSAKSVSGVTRYPCLTDRNEGGFNLTRHLPTRP